jgi:hypothetical protein
MYIYYILHIFNNYVYLQSILISCLKSQNTNVFKGFGGGGGDTHNTSQNLLITNHLDKSIHLEQVLNSIMTFAKSTTY